MVRLCLHVSAVLMEREVRSVPPPPAVGSEEMTHRRAQVPFPEDLMSQANSGHFIVRAGPSRRVEIGRELTWQGFINGANRSPSSPSFGFQRLACSGFLISHLSPLRRGEVSIPPQHCQRAAQRPALGHILGRLGGSVQLQGRILPRRERVPQLHR